MDTYSKSYPPDFVVCAVIIWILLAITTITVSLRIWVRVTITKTLGKDDAFLVASHAINTTSAIFWMYVSSKLGDYPPRSHELFAALSLPLFCGFACYALASALIKISIGFFFLKVTHQLWQKMLVLVVVIVYLVTMLVCFAIIVFRCGTPLSPERILGSETCTIGGAIEASLGLSIATLNSICDWTLAIMPVYLVVSTTRLDRIVKISASSIIAIAVAGSVVSLVRLPYFVHSTLGPAVFEHNTVVIFLSNLETAVGAITVSLATLQPLLKLFNLSPGSRCTLEEQNPTLPQAPTPWTIGADWSYSAIALKNKTRDIAILSLSKLGVLPDTILTGRSVSRDERHTSVSMKLHKLQSTSLSVSRITRGSNSSMAGIECALPDILVAQPTAFEKQKAHL